MNPVLSVGAIAFVVLATVVIGFFGLRISRTTDDFLVASRTVRPWWNASAISGEYLSAATFLGLAGLILLSGSSAFWFPIGYSAGYLALLLFVAAPLRRSGARTIPDFFDARLDSAGVRRLTSVLVVLIAWLYIVPQFHGAALAINVVLGLPPWVGAVGVAVLVAVIVAAGGMRSITFVQAFHYWLKLTALAVPVMFLLIVTSDSGISIDPALVFPVEAGPANQNVYGTVSLLLALLLGTMGLPHVLVRFYTSPTGGSARSTTVIVIVMISVFYMVSTTMGLIARRFAGDLASPATADSVVLLLPSRLIPGVGGQLLTALIIAGAFAAFIATASGLVVSIAGVVSQEVLGGGVRAFRISALASVVVPLLLTFVTVPNGLTSSVGLVFLVAASSLSPVLLLGVWWRGLTARGAIAGMLTGSGSVALALIVTAFGSVSDPVLEAALAQPAAWIVPLATLTTVLVSLGTRRHRSGHVDRFFLRLHAPER
ncbi:Na+(H+)/acetate symporter ActP [Salinibacterium sp. CAN_S4]|uniref:sodium/solute symporter n=1 Tax=Salinibacterium sp. CAN_S4 TaxID=2787727 RepID=UPI0018EFA46F